MLTEQRGSRAWGLGKLPIPIPGPSALELREAQNQQVTPRSDEASWPLDVPGRGGGSSDMRFPPNSPHKVICIGLDVHFKLCVIGDLVFFWLYSLVLELLEACIRVAFLQRRFVLPSACYLKAQPGTTLSYFQPLKLF